MLVGIVPFWFASAAGGPQRRAPESLCGGRGLENPRTRITGPARTLGVFYHG